MNMMRIQSTLQSCQEMVCADKQISLGLGKSQHERILGTFAPLRDAISLSCRTND